MIVFPLIRPCSKQMNWIPLSDFIARSVSIVSFALFGRSSHSATLTIRMTHTERIYVIHINRNAADRW